VDRGSWGAPYRTPFAERSRVEGPIGTVHLSIGLWFFVDRNTPQRDAIRALFTPEGRPLSPSEILEMASETIPTLSQATVYRTLRALEDAGEIVAVEFPSEPARYEMAGKEHHHHFRCESCGKAFETHGCAGDLSPMIPEGFRVTRHEITLYGLCQACTPG